MASNFTDLKTKHNIMDKKTKIYNVLFDHIEDKGGSRQIIEGSEFEKIVDKLVKLFAIPDVSDSTSSIAELITALNETLLANKEVGLYKHIEKACIKKLGLLINSIE